MSGVRSDQCDSSDRTVDNDRIRKYFYTHTTVYSRSLFRPEILTAVFPKPSNHVDRFVFDRHGAGGDVLPTGAGEWLESLPRRDESTIRPGLTRLTFLGSYRVSGYGHDQLSGRR